MVSMHTERAETSVFWRRHRRGLEELRRALLLGIVGIMAGWSMACSPLEPIDESGTSDLQLTVDTLKTSMRDSQRTIAELRAEADSRRQELAELHIARAQLEGRVREAERRLSEARHVIELQREELAGSRSERERTSKTGARLHSQLKQPQKPMAAVSTPAGAGMAGIASPVGQRTGRATAGSDQPDWLGYSEAVGLMSAAHRSARAILDEGPQTPNPVRISVKPGDTLWSLAQRYRISLKRLMAVNRLVDTQIQAGQALWLAEPPASSSRSPEAAE